MEIRAKTLLGMLVLLMASTALAFPGENLITGMFTADFTPAEQDFIDRKFDQGGFSIMSGPDFKVERKRGTSYVYPQGIDMKKFDKNIFNTSLQNSPGYRDRENFQILVQESETLNQLENQGLISIESRFNSSDYASVELLNDASTVFKQLSNSDTNEVDLNYRVKALNDDADDVLGGPKIRNNLGVNGSGITIAVLDTGVNSSHPDFQGRIVDQKDFTESNTVEDKNGHGTHVAGSALGDGSASSGQYAGTAPEASLMSVKVLEESGSGNLDTIISGIDYAANNSADVISMSLGGRLSTEYTPLTSSVQNARDNGSVVIAAAGNDGYYNYTSVPAAIEGAIAVGATNDAKDVTSFTSKGPVPYDGRPKPEVAAPGVRITSAKYNTSQDYTEKSGTSMSTPLVSGIAALALEENTGWTNEGLENALTASGSSNKLDNSQNVFQVGTGVVNASRVVNPEITFSETSFNFLDAPAYVDNSQTVTVTNNAPGSVNYSIGSQIHRFDSITSVSQASNASISFDRDYIQLDSGESKNLDFNFTISEENSDPFGALIRLNEVDSSQSYGLIAGGTSVETGVKADFSLNSTQIDVTDSVKADASASEPESASYSWSMGDGTGLSGEVIEHSYDSLGNYTIELVLEENGDSSSKTKQVEVKDLYSPTADFTTNTSTAEVGLEDVRFDASGSSDNYQIDSYEWDFGNDGSIDFTTENPELVKKFNETGLKTVELTVYDPSGKTDSAQVDIDVQDTTSPNAVADSNTSTLTVGEDVELDASGSTDNYQIKNYTWNNSLSGETVETSFSEPGTKNIGLDVYDQSDNLGEDSLTLEVNDETDPVPKINITPQPAETGLEEVTFNASESYDNVEITDYRWDLYENGTTENGVSISKTFDSPGNYSVKLEVEDSSSNINSTVSDFEIVDTKEPDIEFELDNDYPETEETIKLNASNSTDNHEIKNFTWSMGDGTEYNGETVQHSYSSEGNYTATLEVFDQSSNKASENIEIKVEDLNVSLTSPQTQVSEYKQWINASFTRPVTDVNISLNSEDLTVNEKNSTYFYTEENLPEGNNTLEVEASNDLNYSTNLTQDVEGLYPPVIEFLDIKPRLGTDQVNFTANITEDNFNETNLTLTLPNSTEKQVNLENITEKKGETAWNTSYTPEKNGTYSAELNVTDGLGLNTSLSKEFKVSKPVDFNNSFTSSVEWGLKDAYGDERETGTGNFNITIPADENWELEIADNNLNTTIEGTNVTEDINTTVKWSSQASNPDIDQMTELKTAALKPDLNFSQASIQLNVSGADSLYRCSNYNFTNEECETTWDDVTDQASFSSNSVSLDTTSFSAFTAAEEESTEEEDSENSDGSDGSDDSGSGSSSGGPTSGGGGGFTPPDPEIEVETAQNSVYIYNIYEADEIEPDTGLPIEKISFDPENPEKETIKIEETSVETNASMQSIFEVNSSLESADLEIAISEDWLEENNFTSEEISLYSWNSTWTDQMPEKQNLSVNATVENGTYGLGSEKACYSIENVSAVNDSCKVYANPCEVPEDAEIVESCRTYEQEQDLRQRISDAKEHASGKKLESIENAESLVEEGNLQQAGEELDRIETQENSLWRPVLAVIILILGLILITGFIYFYRKRKKKQVLEELEELGTLLKKLDHQGRNVQEAEEKLLQAYQAVEKDDFSKAADLTDDVRDLVK